MRSLLLFATLFVSLMTTTRAPLAADDLRNTRLRGSLDNSRIRFAQERQGRVAFLGGSITEMNGYRPMVMDLLRRRFPETDFTFIDAGISSTCSTTGAFRLASDVLSQGPIDLLFVEFAVNDDQDAHHARRECIRGMEGIVRHLRRENPRADIIMVHFVNPEMLKTLQEGKTPLTAGAHEAVAEHYSVSTVNLGREVATRIGEGSLTWEKFGGTHPAPAGNALCTAMIEALLGEAWKTPLATDAKPTAHKLPSPLDEGNYGGGRFVSPYQATLRNGWSLHTPNWSELKGQCRERFCNLPLLCATTPGAELSFKFTGTAVGAYLLAGPDAGIVEASIDGGEFRPVTLYHHYSRGLHYPRTVMFATDLSNSTHTLTLRISEKKPEESTGTAMRIIQFAVNQPE